MTLPDKIILQFEEDPRMTARYIRVGSWSYTASRNRVVVVLLKAIGSFVFMLGCIASGMLLAYAAGFEDAQARVIGTYGSIGIVAVGFAMSVYLRRKDAETSPLNRGATVLVCDRSGLNVTNPVLDWRVKWAAVDAIISIKGATVFRMGGIVSGVPNSALPGGLDQPDFIKVLEEWRQAAGV
ncbi:MAG: hypothetical protein AAF568_00860 [Pseudomonadota bacterium]